VHNGNRTDWATDGPDHDDADERGTLLRVLRRLGWSHRDAVGLLVGAFAAVMILANMLFMQPGPHPAPMVKSGIGTGGTVAVREIRVASIPQARQTQQLHAGDSQANAPPSPVARPLAAVITDIQRELARRGFYGGTVDGRYGPKTDTAIRDFEQAAGLKPSAQPSEVLLRLIAQSPLRARPPVEPKPAPLLRPDPIADLLSPSKRVVAVQRALTEFGYGQINPTGIVDAATQVAIEEFERQRKLPITGQMSARVARELAAVTGRPLE
jgi:peptidoglycan hydrolase-like protein with peptidoglycan-binding domain